MISVGLTGGIGSGKSIVAQMFELLNIPTYNSDMEAKKIMETNVEVKNGIINILGKESYKNNKLNKEFIALQIFSDNKLKEKVNNIVHKFVIQHFRNWKENQINTKFVVIESAILLENNLASINKFNILVVSPIELKIKRLIERGLSKFDIEQRMLSQYTDEQKVKYSDFVIYNNEKKFISEQILSVIKKINNC